MSDPNQLSLIYDFNKETRTPFNDILFEDSDVSIVEAVEKVILSCQRNSFFTIKVLDFEVIEEYDKIIALLKEHEDGINKNNGKDNVYDYINLKDTAMRLLVVTYYIAIKDESDTIKVLIGLPRSVDRYYFRINGNTYSAMWQIVDASTYNSATSSSKRDSVTLKTLFQPLRIYRYQTNKKNDLVDYATGEKFRCTYFTSYVFKKSLMAMKYMLAKFGFYGAMKFLHLDCIYVLDRDPSTEGFDPKDYHTLMKNEIYICVPRVLFNASVELQSFVYTVYMSINKDTLYREFFTTEFWLISLASEFNNKTIEKGLSILDSLEFVLDLITKEDLALPEEDKADVYCVIRWIIGEFSNLSLKSNLDVSIKRIRRAKYIASLYAMKLSTSIYRISDIGKKAKLESIEKALRTSPTYLLGQIANCKLVNYRNYVNDMDALVALKFTFKGIAGIGEKNNSIPNVYRAVSKYQLGITDPDASSAGDPGASGTLCPTAKVYEGGMLSEYVEPNFWKDNIDRLFANYKQAIGLKECFIAANTLLGQDTSEQIKQVDETIDYMDNVVKPLIAEAYDNSYEQSTGSMRKVARYLDDKHLLYYMEEAIPEEDYYNGYGYV